jgi:hypothetical protein
MAGSVARRADLLRKGESISLKFLSQLFREGTLSCIQKVVERVQYGFHAPVGQTLRL